MYIRVEFLTSVFNKLIFYIFNSPKRRFWNIFWLVIPLTKRLRLWPEAHNVSAGRLGVQTQPVITLREGADLCAISQNNHKVIPTVSGWWVGVSESRRGGEGNEEVSTMHRHSITCRNRLSTFSTRQYTFRNERDTFWFLSSDIYNISIVLFSIYICRFANNNEHV